MYKVSVIMPCYNVENTIDRAMVSLVTQDIGFQNIEVFIPCDLSSDKTVKKALEWKHKFPDNIRVSISMSRQMQGALRNRVINDCQGEYIAFLDGDDWLEKDALRKAYTCGNKFNADIVNFQFVQVKSTKYNRPQRTKDDLFKFILTPEERSEFFMKSNLLRCCWDKLYRTDFVKEHELRFSERKFEEESLFTTPAYMYAERIYMLNECLYCYYQNPEGSTSSMKYSRVHSRDNERVWLETYERVVQDGSLKSDSKFFEWLFIVNYFFYSIMLAKNRGVEHTEEEKDNLARTVKKLFPNYLDNELLQRTTFDLNEITTRLSTDLTGEEKDLVQGY